MIQRFRRENGTVPFAWSRENCPRRPVNGYGMGWPPEELAGPQYVILSHLGGIRAPDGSPIALGWHTGHYELGVAMADAAIEFARAGAVPYAGYCTDPCDGRTQGTPGMFDSLPYRNDAASIFRRLIRSIPTARGILGVATCDKSLPAMMMALAGFGDLPGVLMPGGVTLPPTNGEDTGKVQSIGARFARGELYLSWGHQVAVVTDARFSGVSTGACIGLVGPEALAGGPLGKVRENDRIRIWIDCNRLEGIVDLVGDAHREFTPEEAARVLAERPLHPELAPDPDLPEETRLWAALQQFGGGTWGGCVYDVDAILRRLGT